MRNERPRRTDNILLHTCAGAQTDRFDVEVIADEDSVAIVFQIPKPARLSVVERVLSGLIYAFAITERKSLDEMEGDLSTMMTLTRRIDGTEVRLQRSYSDASYLSRFGKAISGTTIFTH